MSTQRRFEVLKDLFETNKQSITLGELIRIQKELFSYNIRALVGLRQETGYFTAGKPHFDRVFSPFGFATYEEALKKSIEQGFDNFNITQPKIQV